MARNGIIAIFLNSLRPGGAERAMVNLAGGLRARGGEVAIVLVSEEGPLREIIAPGIQVVDLRADRTVASLPALVRWLRLVRPRVLLSGCANSNVVAVLGARLANVGIRTVVCEHTTLSRVPLDTRRLRHMLVPAAARWAYPRADAVVAVSEGVAHDLESVVGLPRNRVRVIPNPLTPTIALDALQAPRHEWLRDGGPPVLLSVARLIRAKDIPTLLRAFALLRARRAARLVILGEGEERQRLQMLIERLGIGPDVDLAGYVANPYSSMAAAAGLVLSSRREGLPTVLIEALALGTPVVSTDCSSGPREILEDGRFGRLVPPRDPQALAVAMDELLVNGRSPAPQSALDRYSLDAVADCYLDVLDARGPAT